MKKYQMLEKAMKDYPKGTKFISLFGCEIESSGSFFIDGTGSVAENPSNCNVHESETGKWAEIVKPKIAVRVDNEKEFNALMKYYDSLGYVWNGGDKASDKKGLQEYPNNIEFENKAQHTIPKNSPDHKIVNFSDFAKEHNIKLPLFKTHDGIDIYHGDNFCMVEDLELSEWEVNPFNNKNTDKQIFTAAAGFTELLGKPFSTKESALKWIEEQKPKEKYMQIGSNTIVIKSNCVNGLDQISWLSDNDIEFIYKAMQELS